MGTKGTNISTYSFLYISLSATYYPEILFTFHVNVKLARLGGVTTQLATACIGQGGKNSVHRCVFSACFYHLSTHIDTRHTLSIGFSFYYKTQRNRVIPDRIK